MPRARNSTYAGARGRVTLDKGARLGADWAVQVKRDGIYCELATDYAGRVDAAYTRTGRRVRTDLLGVQTGMPLSRLAGELTAQTERGRQEAAQLGYQRCHLFDILAYDGIELASHPYRWRRDLLLRCAAEEWSRPGCGYHWYHDRRGRARDPESHRFVERDAPRGWRRLPIVEQRPAHQAPQLWDDLVETGTAEGLVFVRLSAPLGVRASKRKCKPVRTMDCLVVSCGRRYATVRGGCGAFRVGTGKMAYLPGTVVLVSFEGFYLDGTPRFPRITGTRPDLTVSSVPYDTVVESRD